MCSACNGLGVRTEIDPELVVPDPKLSIRKGAIAPWASSMERGDGWTYRTIEGLAKATGVDLDVPFGKLPKKMRDQVLFGLDGKKIQITWGKEGSGNHGSWGVRFHGVIPTLMRRFRETASERMRDQYQKYMRDLTCDVCEGRRLRTGSLAVRVGNKSIAEVLSLAVSDCAEWFDELELAGSRQAIAEGPLREIRSRLSFLLNVGLDYLTLERAATLCGNLNEAFAQCFHGNSCQTLCFQHIFLQCVHQHISG
jgi:excinuclease ABC subunit A